MASETTIVIVPRERFSFALESLDNVLQRTSQYQALVYVDGGSPAPVRDQLRQKAERHGFTLLRSDQYLSPNEARNLALPHVRSRYVLFADNDILVAPDWASRLQACADETGAWLVGPLYCERLPEQSQVHMAGGETEIRQLNGRRTLYEQHFWPHRPMEEVRGRIARGPTGLIEFHAALVRMDTFDSLGPLDERLLSAAEHVDLSLSVRNRAR
jgi:GT2 family glycosyltransferase